MGAQGFGERTLAQLTGAAEEPAELFEGGLRPRRWENEQAGGVGTDLIWDRFARRVLPLWLTKAEALAALAGGSTFAVYMVAANRSYDYDSSETVGEFIAKHSLLDPLRRQFAFNNHPLFSLVEHFVYSAGGTSAAALRVLPCAFGAATVALLVVWAVRRWGLLAGAAAGLLVAVNPLFADLARSVRGYSLLSLCALASTLALVRLLEGGGRASGMSYVALVAIGVATHVYMLFVVIAQVAAVTAAGSVGRRWLARWLAALALGSAVYAALAIRMADRVVRGLRHFDAAFPGEAAHSVLGDRWLAVFSFALLALLGLIAVRRRAVLAAVAAIALVLGVDWALLAPLDLYPRFLVWLVPGFALLGAAAVRRWPQTVVLVVLGCLVMMRVDLAGWSAAQLPSGRAAALVARLRQEDMRVCVLPFTRGALMAYTSTPPPEVRSKRQFGRCGAVVGLAVGPRRLLRSAERAFPYMLILSAETPMMVLSRRVLEFGRDRVIAPRRARALSE